MEIAATPGKPFTKWLKRVFMVKPGDLIPNSSVTTPVTSLPLRDDITREVNQATFSIQPK